MTFEEISQRLQDEQGEAIIEVKPDALDPFFVVDPSALREVALHLRDAEGLRFDTVSNLTGTDLLADEKIQVVYHLWSYTHQHQVVLKVELPRDEPRVDSVADVWPGADWFEREAYDLVGVEFNGHPDLRRILLPEGWEGFPLRKDYAEAPEYHGMPTTRTFTNELFDKLDVETLKARPFKALLIFDDSGKGAEEAGQTLAIRLRVADIDTELKPVSAATPAELPDYDLLIFGANSKGLLFGGPSSKMGSFIDLLPKLDDKPCALYVVYTAHPGQAIRELDAKVRHRDGRIIARGSAPRRWPKKDPDGLAAKLVDLIRSGELARLPAPEEPVAEEEAAPPTAADKAAPKEAGGADAS